MMHLLKPKSIVTGNQDKESALKEPTIKGYENYRCPHLVRAARGRKSPSWKRDNYKTPIVTHLTDEEWERIKDEYEATRPISKEKEKHSK